MILMAYIRDICNSPCSRCGIVMATKEVINRFNAPCGKFCTRCAKQKLAELEKAERNANVES